MDINFNEPIIILGSPRSGTSLTAQIFQSHGVWVGTSKDRDQWNPKGYCENAVLHIPRLIAGHGDGLDPNLVHELITMDGYHGGHWLVKHSPLTWRAWRNFSPKYVIVRRNTEDIIQSRIRCGLWDMTEAEHRIAVDTDIAILESILKHIGGTEIWPHKLFDNQFDELKTAFQYCGLELNIDEAKSCLDQTLWNTHRRIYGSQNPTQ